MKGYIKLYRDITDNFLWDDKPFSRGQAWIDLLLLVNHADKKVLVDGEVVTVKRGSTLTSQSKLAERWGWSRGKTKKFLDVLNLEQMIELKIDRKKAYLTISNYAVYQDLENTKMTDKKQLNDSRMTAEKQLNDSRMTQTINDKRMIKNDNNPPISPQKAKVQCAEFVAMTNDEYQSLIAKYGEADTKRMVEILDNYKGSSGKKYKSDYRAILNWVIARLTEEKRKKPTSVYDASKTNYDEIEKIIQEKM